MYRETNSLTAVMTEWLKVTDLRPVSVFTAWVRIPLTVFIFLRACGVVVAYLLCKQLERFRLSSGPNKGNRMFPLEI